MPRAWNWAVPHIIGILAALLAGPFLSSLAVVQAYSFPAISLTGGTAVRLAADFLALAILCSLAINAFRELPDNGRGSGFFRQIVLPLTILLVIVYGDKALRGLAYPLVDAVGSARYLWVYFVAMLGSGLWLTVIWLRNLYALGRAFTPVTPSSRAARREDFDSGEFEADASVAPTEKGTTILTANGTVPTMLGRYKVLKELGRGAMGVVYLGKDPTIQRFVAIKTMRLDEIDDDKLKDFKARFFREAESTGRMYHPNIVTIYDARAEQQLGSIAMG